MCFKQCGNIQYTYTTYSTIAVEGHLSETSCFSGSLVSHAQLLNLHQLWPYRGSKLYGSLAFSLLFQYLKLGTCIWRNDLRLYRSRLSSGFTAWGFCLILQRSWVQIPTTPQPSMTGSPTEQKWTSFQDVYLLSHFNLCKASFPCLDGNKPYLCTYCVLF